MTRHNKVIAFDLLEEMISAYEEMSSERRWLESTGSKEGTEYYEQVRKDYDEAMAQYLKLRGEVLSLMVKGMNNE